MLEAIRCHSLQKNLSEEILTISRRHNKYLKNRNEESRTLRVKQRYYQNLNENLFFPPCLKIGYSTTVYKKTKKIIKENYRSVNMPP